MHVYKYLQELVFVNGNHVEKKVKQTLIVLCIAKVAYVDVCLESI